MLPPYRGPERSSQPMLESGGGRTAGTRRAAEVAKTGMLWWLRWTPARPTTTMSLLLDAAHRRYCRYPWLTGCGDKRIELASRLLEIKFASCVALGRLHTTKASRANQKPKPVKRQPHSPHQNGDTARARSGRAERSERSETTVNYQCWIACRLTTAKLKSDEESFYRDKLLGGAVQH